MQSSNWQIGANIIKTGKRLNGKFNIITIMPNMETKKKPLEFIIESCLPFCSDPIIEASESLVPENRKEMASERSIILKMISDV